MRSLTLPAVLSVTICLSVHEARADERGWYVGAAYSGISPNYAPPSRNLAAQAASNTPSRLIDGRVEPLSSQGFKVVAGFRAWDWLAFEVDYLDLSSDTAPLNVVCVTALCPARIEAETSSASLSALALWPVGNFDLFARAGWSRWKSKAEYLASLNMLAFSREVSGGDIKLGGGAQFNFHRVTARLEYEHLRFSGDAADTWSLGFAYRFR